MAKQSPFYRGIYTYVAANKPNGTTVKQNPKYRGIYAYDATRKPSGVFALEGDGNVAAMQAPVPATGSTTPNYAGEAVSPDVEPAPWDTMTQHAQIDGYVYDEDVTTPEGWSTMTIAQKKGWLDANA